MKQAVYPGYLSSVPALAAVTVLVLLLAAGCSGRTPESLPGAGETQSPGSLGFAVHAVDAEGHALDQPAIELRLVPAPAAGAHMQLALAGTGSRHSLYLHLDYDAHRFAPGTVTVSPDLVQQAVMFAIPVRPGLLEVGLASIGEQPRIPAGAPLLDVEYAPGSASPPTRLASAAPPTPVDDVVFSAEKELSWTYYIDGDYDQNGEVGIADITPIGLHFGKTSSSPDWSKARVADGDGNGEVNAADITRIGLNFATRTTSFVVRESAAKDGPFQSISAVANFSDFPAPPGGGPRLFNYTLASPQPNYYYTVYTRDDTDLAAKHSNVLQYTGSSAAPPDIYTLDASVGAGEYSSAAVLSSGLLAVAYIDKAEVDGKAHMRLVRSTTASAMNWYAPIPLGAFNDVNYCSLGSLNGNAYLAYQSGNYLAVTRSTTDGATWTYSTSWSNPSYIIGFDCSLALTSDGDVAVCHGDGKDGLGGNINYSHDHLGNMTFTTDHVISGGLTNCGVSSLAIVNGKPAVSFVRLITLQDFTVYFVRALDTAGVTWASPVTVLAGGNNKLAPRNLVDNGEAPLIVYQAEDAGELRCVAALDHDGLTWRSPAPVAPLPGSIYGDQYAVAIVAGKPVVAYHDNADGKLKLVTAVDSDGQTWGSPVEVIDAPSRYLSLIDFNGKPALSFHDTAANNLKIAVYR